MAQHPEEWLRQADYDMDTADYMFDGGRYFYAVFMCHLSIEKALKGLYRKKVNQEPIGRFVVKLNEASVATRYPEEIRKLQRDFTQRVVKSILSDGRKTLQWIKAQF